MVSLQSLDQFYWEELNPGQEFCRFASLQNVWHLYKHYEKEIYYGYLKTNINNGLCLVNPGNCLQNTDNLHAIFNQVLYKYIGLCLCSK